MPLVIRDPELFGLTESSLTLTFGVFDSSGPVDAQARVRLNGETRATSEGTRGTRHVRIEGLEPDCEYRIQIEVAGAEPPSHDEHFPAVVRTLPQPAAREVASFATLNDLHFGEERFGGVLKDDGEYGPDQAGWDFVRETDTDVPYWQFMNEDAIAEINSLGVDATIIKGDIADRGQPEQFEAAASAFAKFEMPHHAFLGNHDYYARREGREVDGYAILGQLPAPRCVELAGWRLVLLETALPGEHHGVFDEERLAWLADSLAESRDQPTLVFMHHQPVPPQHANSYPNTIGIVPDHSLSLFELIGGNPQIRGVLIGHTHRNRIRHYPDSGRVPFIEINCSKDYPGGFGHYRLFEDGAFRQEVHRTSSPRALTHSTLCRSFFQGGYRNFALGSLAVRSFAVDN
jgi:predicted phosphodiesterase